MASSSKIPTYQVALLGDANVGKTSLFTRLQTGTFVDTKSPAHVTTGRDCFMYHLTVDRTNINVTLFDTAGGERFRSLTRSYHRGKQAVILVYDVESNYTLDDLQQWIDEVERCSDSTDTTWAIFGNKCELEPKFEARILEGYRLELDTNLSFFVSAKTGANVQDAFDSVFAYVHRKATSGRLQVGPTVDEDDCTVDLQETNNGISATRNGRNRIRC